MQFFSFAVDAAAATRCCCWLLRGVATRSAIGQRGNDGWQKILFKIVKLFYEKLALFYRSHYIATSIGSLQMRIVPFVVVAILFFSAGRNRIFL